MLCVMKECKIYLHLASKNLHKLDGSKALYEILPSLLVAHESNDEAERLMH